MLTWILSKYEKSFKRQSSVRAYSADYYFRQMGRRTEVRRCSDRVLYMVLWDVEPTIEAVARAAYLFPSQIKERSTQ
jgi:hypothetical protein